MNIKIRSGGAILSDDLIRAGYDTHCSFCGSDRVYYRAYAEEIICSNCHHVYVERVESSSHALNWFISEGRKLSDGSR